jgi:hypothetical protein
MKKEEVELALNSAIAPLKDEITAIKSQLAQLAPLLKQIKQPEPEAPPKAKEALAIVNSINPEIGNQLKVFKVNFDPNMAWFEMIREDGTRISVKRQECTLRIRLRSKTGALIKELTCPFNGLNSALLSLV